MKYLLIILLILPASIFGQHPTLLSDSSSFITQDTWHSSYYSVYRDTTPLDSSEFLPLLHSFTYSYHNKDHNHDTAFVYNHFKWLMDRIREEQKYYRHLGITSSDLDVKIACLAQSQYYSGMEAMLMDVLYYRGETKWNFKSQDKSKVIPNPKRSVATKAKKH